VLTVGPNVPTSSRPILRWNISKLTEFNLPRIQFKFGQPAMTDRQQTNKQKEFVLESRGRAVLAFLAEDVEKARDLCSQEWFLEELFLYRSYGERIWDGTNNLCIRGANPSEAAEIQIALVIERYRKECDGYVFAFLVPLDANLQ
jgi:hypothetical protein